MTADLPVLLPFPRHLRRIGGGPTLPHRLSYRIELDDPEGAWLRARVETMLRWAGVQAQRAEDRDAFLSVLIDPSLAAQGYRLRTGADGIAIAAGDAAGAFYALATLEQLLPRRRNARASPAPTDVALPALEIEDAPAFAVRGVMLDVSRNKVPTLAELLAMVDLLAALKINHLELYLEHTFSYRGHEAVWADWSPLQAEEIRRLDEHCRHRFVELVPNQNSFGHMHRWLVHEPYRRLAECPEGIRHPFSSDIEPFSLCPVDPRSLALLEDLYDQLLPCFSSRLFNVGLDETFDLGRGRSADECEQRGKGRVYLDYLQAVHGLVEARGHRMLFWADIALEHPELVAEVPRDAIALVWGYEADHPFAEQVGSFAANGIETWVCPGTSSWNSLVGRLDNALGNLATAAREGLAAGARGYLITDWGDFGHLQPPQISLPGFLAGAGLGWHPEQPWGELSGAGDAGSSASQGDHAALDPETPGDGSLDALATAIDHFALADRADGAGAALLELGRLYRLPGSEPRNSSVLFQILLRAGETMVQKRFAGISSAGLETTRAALARARTQLEAATLPGREADLPAVRQLHRELGWAMDGVEIAIELGLARLANGPDLPIERLPAGLRAGLAARLRELEHELVEIWRARYREGGLADSLRYLRRVRERLEAPD